MNKIDNIFESVNVSYNKDAWHKINVVFTKNSETEYGEPQIWIPFSDGTSLEITHETNGLKERERFISMRHHCSEEDFENKKYASTMGVIASFMYAKVSHLETGLAIFLTNMAKKDITIVEDMHNEK